jgi:hypothetical protein
MSYTATPTVDFRSMARQLSSIDSQSAQSRFSNSRELIPTEVRSRMQREGNTFLRRPALNGATVDQEGLTNNYAVEPDMYYSVFPSPEQVRHYAVQGVAAALLMAGLIVTSIAIS